MEGSRAEILAAAAVCFMDRGYTETSIDDVARRLGATKGRVYHHFASKADLFAGIFRAGMEMDYAAIEPFRDIADPLDRLERMAAAHCRQIIRSRPFQRVVWQGVQLLLRGATTPEACAANWSGSTTIATPMRRYSAKRLRRRAMPARWLSTISACPSR